MPATSSVPAARPTSVSIAVTIGWLSVLLDAAGGIALLALAGNDDVVSTLGTDASTVRVIGVVSLVTAALLAFLVSLLGRGSGFARGLVTAVMVLRIGVAAWGLATINTHHLTEAILTMVFAVIAIALLWNEKANAFFATNRP